MPPDEEVDESLFPDAASAAEAEKVWGEGSAAAGPVGTFQVLIKDATLGRSTGSDRLQIAWELEIMDGPSKGKVIRKYDGLATPQQASISKQQLQRLGINVAKIGLPQLPAALMTLKNTLAIVGAKVKGEFYNVTFNKKIEKLTGTGTTGAPPAGGKPKGKKF